LGEFEDASLHLIRKGAQIVLVRRGTHYILLCWVCVLCFGPIIILPEEKSSSPRRAIQPQNEEMNFTEAEFREEVLENTLQLR
jgi:hypothetical protein